MPGVLEPVNYLDTLRSINDFYSTFPSNQTTYLYTITGTNSTGWAATITWQTLIVDQVSWNNQGQPNFANSQVIGYYQGGSTSQYSTGVISLPSYLYTGPILPTSEINVPITIVMVKFTKNGETNHYRFGLFQEYEPGITIADPTTDPYYIPINEEITSLIIISQTLSPSYSVYSTGSSTTYTLTVAQNPGFSPNPNPISNTVTVFLTDQGLPVQTIADQNLLTTNFVNGIVSATFTITNSLIDFALTNPGTEYAVTTSTLVGSDYLATFQITNTHKIKSVWLEDLNFEYSGGSAELIFKAQGVKQQLITGQTFSISVATSENPVDLQENFDITVDASNVKFNNTITLYLNTGSTTLTIANFNYSSLNPNNIFTTTYAITTAGVFNIYAAYPGDILTNTSTALLSTQSNIITQVVLEGNTLPTTSSFTSTLAGDVIRVYATSTATLTNNVSFFEGTTFLGSATWQREIISINTVTTTTNYPDEGFFPVWNWADKQPQATPFWTTDWATTSTYEFKKWTNVDPFDFNFNETRNLYPINSWPVKNTLLRYKSPSESTATWLNNVLDTIQTTGTYSVRLGNQGYNVIGLVAVYSAYPNAAGAAQGIRWPYFYNNLPRPIKIGGEDYTLVEWLGLKQVLVKQTGNFSTYVWIHYYRFTPEIPPSNNSWNLRRDYTRSNPFDSPNMTMVSRNPRTENAIAEVGLERGVYYGNFPPLNTLSNRWLWLEDGNTYIQRDTGDNNFFLVQRQPPPNVDDARDYAYLIRSGPNIVMWFDFLNWRLYRLNFTRYNPPISNLMTWDLIPIDAYYNPPSQASFQAVYNNFGNQTWTSTDLNSPAANEIARRANSWFNAVTTNQVPYYSTGTVHAPAYSITTTVTNITYSNVYIATLTLSTGTIVNPFNLTATWPGTLALGPEFGKYNPFNIAITYP